MMKTRGEVEMHVCYTCMEAEGRHRSSGAIIHELFQGRLAAEGLGGMTWESWESTATHASGASAFEHCTNTLLNVTYRH